MFLLLLDACDDVCGGREEEEERRDGGEGERGLLLVRGIYKYRKGVTRVICLRASGQKSVKSLESLDVLLITILGDQTYALGEIRD